MPLHAIIFIVLYIALATFTGGVIIGKDPHAEDEIGLVILASIFWPLVYVAAFVESVRNG